ncbi:MFS transporter [Marinobacterium aestuariivivens]|uniref:Nitrate/nitrite transporter n=1 Tax=Marinobacterium aestuariivivens TaxID=1698799 RepID=A0ABW2A2J1_9GAMM
MTTLLRLIIPFAFGYMLSYLFRVIGAVVSPALVDELGLDASTLGLISSFYFLTFAACQLPLGVMLDRIEVRKLTAALLLIAAAGSLVFATAETATGLLIGRGLIGIGVSACLMGAFKAYVLWLPTARLPLVNGIQLSSGGIGAMLATTPVELALGITDWRGLFIAMAGLCMLASLLLWFLVPKRAVEATTGTPEHPLRTVLGIVRDPRFYCVAPASLLCSSTFIAVQSLWAGDWLREVMQRSPTEAADLLFVMACGVISGFLLMGLIADRLQHLGLPPRNLSLAGILIFVSLMILLQFDGGAPNAILWALLGFFSTSGSLMFASLAQQFPRHQSGRVSTSLNLGIFVSAFLIQWGLGGIVELWEADSAGHYPAAAYRVAFALAAAIPAAGLLWYWLSAARLNAVRRQPDRPKASST